MPNAIFYLEFFHLLNNIRKCRAIKIITRKPAFSLKISYILFLTNTISKRLYKFGTKVTSSMYQKNDRQKTCVVCFKACSNRKTTEKLHTHYVDITAICLQKHVFNKQFDSFCCFARVSSGFVAVLQCM